MGKRDYSHREQKKAKKDPKKLHQITITTPVPEVEVIRKGKRREGREVEEEEIILGTPVEEWSSMEEQGSLKAVVKGRVQGVFFRCFVSAACRASRTIWLCV